MRQGRSRGEGRLRAPSGVSGARGQATTETMMMMMFLLFLVFGFVHMSMLATTKYVVNYAAFAAARAAMVGGNETLAALTVLDNVRWSNPLMYLWQVTARETRTIRGKSREGVRVTFKVPFGLPIFNSIPFGGISLRGFSPLIEQPNIPENGDNAQ